MSKVCELCGKGYMKGNNVSFSNRKSIRRMGVNLQKATVNVNGKDQKLNICTRCKKTLAK